MNVIAKTILGLGYKCDKAVVLRLCTGKNYRPNISNLLKRSSTLGIIPDQNVHLVLCRNCTAVAFKETNESNNVDQTGKPISGVAQLYELFHESVHYSNTVSRPVIAKMFITNEEAEKLLDENWSSANALDMYNAIKKLAYNRLSNGEVFGSERYENILAAFRDKLCDLDDQKLKKLLQYLQPLQSVIKKSAYYPTFRDEISKECMKRFFGSNFNELLLIVDLFYQLNEMRVDYVWRAMRKMGSKPFKLTSKNLVQYLFLLSNCPNPKVNMFELEYRLSECIDDLSPKELSLASLGFFRTKTVIKSPDIMNQFIRRMMTGLNDLDSIYLASAMKIMRYSTKLREVSVFRLFLSSILPQVPRLSLICLMHIAHASANAGVYERDLMNAIIDRFVNEISDARIKDIERLLFATTTLCPEMSDQLLTDTVTSNLLSTYNTTRAKEIEKYASALPRILAHLSYKNIYCEELLQHIFQPVYLHKLHHGNLYSLSRDVFTLHHSVLIDFPSYTGPLLDKNVISILTKKFCKSQTYSEESKSRKLLIEIIYTCKDVLNTEIYSDRIMPHFDLPDIILARNEDNNFIPVEPILSPMSIERCKRVDTEELKIYKWVALVVIPYTQIVKGSDKYVGFVYSKLRHLKALGYTPVTISQVDWDRFVSPTEKQNYIKKIIFDQKNDLNSLST